jgi:adenine phosphoribosyltransferase
LTGPERLRSLIREIPDFPRPGISFKDITPLLADPGALAESVQALAAHARPLEVQCVVAAEARGFLLGPALALEMGAGFVLARKPGKLPYETISAEYVLEYGAEQLELHSDSVHAGTRVLVHDDLLATGGTAAALCGLVEQLGGEVVGCNFLVELSFLDGRAALAPHDAYSLLVYDS